MATNFSSAAYVAALQALLDRHDVQVTVRGFRPGRDYADLDQPVAELVIDEFPCGATGALRELDGTLNAGLLVLRRLDVDEAEEHALELAFDVATALVDEFPEPEEGAPTPVMPAGPVMVTGVEPDQPDGVLRHRVCGWLVRFEQQWRIRRSNQPTEPAPLTTLLARLGPDMGPSAPSDYRRLVPPAPLPGEEEEE